MKAYRYDSVSKKYVGEVNCQKDPIATQQAGEDVWLLPAHATFEQPLEPKDGYNVVWNGSAWEYQEIPQPEPYVPTHEDVERMRIAYRHSHIDDFTLRRARKQANGTWTEEDEQEYLALDAEVTAYIEEHFPYPTDPIIEGGNDAGSQD